MKPLGYGFFGFGIFILSAAFIPSSNPGDWKPIYDAGLALIGCSLLTVGIYFIRETA